MTASALDGWVRNIESVFKYTYSTHSQIPGLRAGGIKMTNSNNSIKEIMWKKTLTGNMSSVVGKCICWEDLNTILCYRPPPSPLFAGCRMMVLLQIYQDTWAEAVESAFLKILLMCTVYSDCLASQFALNAKYVIRLRSFNRGNPFHTRGQCRVRVTTAAMFASCRLHS